MPFVTTDKPNFTADLAGWTGKFFHSDNMSFMHYTIDANAGAIPLHKHVNEEVWNIIEGTLEVTIGEDTQVVGPGDVALVPSDVEHALKPMGPAKVIVVNYPHRTTI
jgi:mannose-6-phosphate isomerase-like protein (cupin superfamily)